MILQKKFVRLRGESLVLEIAIVSRLRNHGLHNCADESLKG